MPIKRKLPEWEREDNRRKVFYALLRKPMTFSELIKETDLSTATLSAHLRDLQRERVIERTIHDKRRVYKVILNEDSIMGELKKASYNTLIAFLSETQPLIAKMIDGYVKTLAKLRVLSIKREMEGKPLTLKEAMKKTAELIESEFPRSFWSKDLIEELKNPSEETLTQYEKLIREARKKMEG